MDCQEFEILPKGIYLHYHVPKSGKFLTQTPIVFTRFMVDGLTWSFFIPATNMSNLAAENSRLVSHRSLGAPKNAPGSSLKLELNNFIVGVIQCAH